MQKIFIILFFGAAMLFANNYNTAIDYYQKGDMKNAFIYFKKAANQKDIKSAYILGYLYTGGIGTKQDLKKAVKWYEIAAKAGNVKAQVNLGFNYIGGLGVEKDYKKAAYWIYKAKDKSPQAQNLWDEFHLSQYYNKGN
jgi:TPR repeat protein